MNKPEECTCKVASLHGKQSNIIILCNVSQYKAKYIFIITTLCYITIKFPYSLYNQINQTKNQINIEINVLLALEMIWKFVGKSWITNFPSFGMNLDTRLHIRYLISKWYIFVLVIAMLLIIIPSHDGIQKGWSSYNITMKFHEYKWILRNIMCSEVQDIQEQSFTITGARGKPESVIWLDYGFKLDILPGSFPFVSPCPLKKHILYNEHPFWVEKARTQKQLFKTVFALGHGSLGRDYNYGGTFQSYNPFAYYVNISDLDPEVVKAHRKKMFNVVW